MIKGLRVAFQRTQRDCSVFEHDGVCGARPERGVHGKTLFVVPECFLAAIRVLVQVGDRIQRPHLGRGVVQFPRDRERLLQRCQSLIVAPEIPLHRSDRLVVDALPAAVTELAIDRQRFVVRRERGLLLAEALARLPDACERELCPARLSATRPSCSADSYAASAPA